jgi:hypothetical protein
VSYAWHSCPITTHPSKTLVNPKPNSLTSIVRKQEGGEL